MNKNRFYYGCYIAIVCTVSLFAACSQEECIQTPYNNEQLPLNIVPTVGETFTRTTGANGSYRFSVQDSIGLFAVKSGNPPSSSDKVYNQKYTYNGSSWNVQSGKVHWPTGELGTPCVIYGYYPYTKVLSNPQKHVFTVNSDQSTVENMYASDFLYTMKPVNKENAAVILNMSHLFSMITVNIKYEDTGDICSDINIKAKQIATINLLNGEAAANGYTVAITPAVLEKASAGYSKSYSAIIPPQQVDNETPFLSLLLGDDLKEININRNFEEGKHYSVNLTIAKDKSITLQGVYVSQWDEQITIPKGSKNEAVIYNTGDVIEYQKKRDRYPVTIVVTGDGFTKEHMLKGGLFEQYATEAIEFMFDVEPFKSYRDYFNIYFIAAISNTSQFNTTGLYNDTYFGTMWSNSTGRLSRLNSGVYNFLHSYCPDIKRGTTTITKVVTIVLVNYADDYPDGVTTLSGNGENYAMSTLPKGIFSWIVPNADNAGTSIGDWRNAVLHEAGGHAFGRLLDEYWYENSTRVVDGGSDLIGKQHWTVPLGKNVADNISENSQTCYWNHLKGNPLFPKVGYYEGAYLHAKDFWRSEEASCMIDNRRYFNAYSRQLIVERIKSLSNEPFSFDDFIAKDVNYDEILDKKAGGANSRILKGTFSDSELKKCPPLSPPVLIDK